MVEFNCSNSPKRSQGKESVLMETSFSKVHVLYVDAEVFEEGVMVMGCVIKDLSKEVFVETCKREMVSVEPKISEMLTVRWGLILEKELKLDKIIIHSDALVEACCH